MCTGQDERKRHVTSPTDAEAAEEAEAEEDPESLEYLADVLRNLRGKAQRHVFFTGRPLAAQVRCLVDVGLTPSLSALQPKPAAELDAAWISRSRCRNPNPTPCASHQSTSAATGCALTVSRGCLCRRRRG